MAGTTVLCTQYPARVTKVRQRFYYHVTYTDGDEEELSQAELRDGYDLGLSGEIEAQWLAHKGKDIQTVVQETDLQSDCETSDGEGSEYDTRDYESELQKHKRKWKEDRKRAGTQKKRIGGCRAPPNW